MRMICKDEIQQYSAEQIAGLVLTILKEVDQKELKVSHYPGSIQSILTLS